MNGAKKDEPIACTDDFEFYRYCFTI